MFYTGVNPVFSTTTLFGTFAAPNGSFTVVGSQILNPSDTAHYFWLAYDLTGVAILGNKIDASVQAWQVDSAGNNLPVYPTHLDTSGNNYVCNIGTEICDNGLDDDRDGLVDCYDSDCSGVGKCVSDANLDFYGLPAVICNKIRPIEPFQMKTLWAKSLSTSTAQITMPIGDLDGDNIPEIVVLGYAEDSLYVLDGQNGSAKYKIMVLGLGGYLPAIADVDGDGQGEIFVVQNGNMACYDPTLNLKWVNSSVLMPVGLNVNLSINIADFNEDNVPEIWLSNGYIYNAVTGTLIIGINDFGYGSNNINVVGDLWPDGYCPDCNGLELITQDGRLFSVDIANKKVTRELSGFFKGNLVLADFNGDGLLDVVASRLADQLTVWDPRTNAVIVGSVTLPGTGAGNGPGLPCVGDFNNDGLPEVCVHRRDSLSMWDNNLNLMWVAYAKDLSSGGVPFMGYDFEGDNLPEVVIRGELNPKSSLASISNEHH